MKVIPTDIEGVVIIEPDVFGDARGYFMESWSQQRFNESVREVEFVQDNQSKSCYGVVRGLHFQRGEYSQSKLVGVAQGRVLDVAVDIRRGSPTFGRHIAVELSDENHRQLFIPRGFAHGFVVLSETAIFAYKCTDFYHPEDEGGLPWNDPTISIDWQAALTQAGIEIGMEFQLSDKDTRHPAFDPSGSYFDLDGRWIGE